MNLASYTDVKTAVAQWLDRADLTEQIPVFIELAESNLNRILCDNVNLVVSSTLTFSGASVSVPDDFNGMVSISGAYGRIDYKTAAEFYAYPAQAGIPRYYTVSAGQISIWPTPGSDGVAVSVRYRTKLDLLKYGPNWLLDNHPDAYLFGALAEAAGFAKEEPRGPVWQAKFNDIMAAINKQGQDIAFGGPLQVKSCGGE